MTFDISRLTLGQLLTSDDATIKRNAVSILKIAQNCDHRNENGRCIYCFRPQAYRPAQWCGTCDLPADQCKNDHD